MNDTIKTIINDSIGFCQRSKSGEVVFQNSICQQLCGNWLGRSCNVGCQRNQASPEIEDEYGFTVLKDIHQEESTLVDAVKLVKIEQDFTFLFDKSELYLKLMNQLLVFNPSKMEIEVYSLVLRGYSNFEIADKLCISKNTVRSHINSLRKKIPRHIFSKRNKSI